jgi:serine/threonine protein kinase
MRKLEHEIPLKTTLEGKRSARSEVARFHDSTRQDPLIGRLIDGRYSVMGKLGEGGMACVYLAIDSRDGRRVAFKIAREGDSAKMNAFIEKEVRALRKIGSEKVAGIFDDGEFEGRRYIAIRFAAGESLEEALGRKEGLPWRKCKEVLIQVCDALQSAHDAGFVHRDVKPANIMVENDGNVSLIDFGLATDMTEPEAEEPGLVVGTPMYVAPETVSGPGFDHRVDVYAMGVMMYKMVSGTPPFSGTAGEVVMQHLDTVPLLPSLMKPFLWIPLEIEALIMRALEKDPEKRFGSMMQMKRAIEAAPSWEARIRFDEAGWSLAEGPLEKTRDLKHGVEAFASTAFQALV